MDWYKVIKVINGWRIAFFKSFDEQKPSLNPPFSSVYLTKGLLLNRIVFEDVSK